MKNRDKLRALELGKKYNLLDTARHFIEQQKSYKELLNLILKIVEVSSRKEIENRTNINLEGKPKIFTARFRCEVCNCLQEPEFTSFHIGSDKVDPHIICNVCESKNHESYIKSQVENFRFESDDYFHSVNHKYYIFCFLMPKYSWAELIEKFRKSVKSPIAIKSFLDNIILQEVSFKEIEVFEHQSISYEFGLKKNEL